MVLWAATDVKESASLLRWRARTLANLNTEQQQDTNFKFDSK
jgi:hypothetical protein